MTDPEQENGNRGRDAGKPTEIPKPGWRDILLRMKEDVGRDRVSIIAAGVAFYALLAVFPAIAALISIWGLAFDPDQIEQQIRAATDVLPSEAANILRNQARAVASQAGAGVSIGAIGGILLATYSTTKGVKALMDGLNAVYKEEEKRGIIKRNLAAMALSLGLIGMVLLALGSVVVLPALVSHLGLTAVTQALLTYAKWPILALLVIFGLGVVYRFAPSRTQPRQQWISFGALVATLFWILGSILFSLYVRNFASYNETYGSIGAVVILLMWFWLSAFIILLGAELNSEIEHQTARDTTRGAPKPMGQRGAYVADTVGRKP